MTRRMYFDLCSDSWVVEEDGTIVEHLPPWIGSPLTHEWALLLLTLSEAKITYTHRKTGKKFGYKSGLVINEHLWDEPPPAWTLLPCPDSIKNMQLMSDAPIGR